VSTSGATAVLAAVDAARQRRVRRGVAGGRPAGGSTDEQRLLIAAREPVVESQIERPVLRMTCERPIPEQNRASPHPRASE
jgi:hypothetical protein